MKKAPLAGKFSHKLTRLFSITNQEVLTMLVLSRKIGESIKIGEDIEITILRVHHNQVRVGIKAPKKVAVHRDEIYKKIKTQLSRGDLYIVEE